MNTRKTDKIVIPFSQEELVRMIDYDPITGIAKWSVNSGKRSDFIGKELGYRCRLPNIDYAFLTHRVLCKLIYGTEPDIVDHENGDQRDNRKLNLSDGTNKQNCENQIMSKANTSGFTGVYLFGNKYQAGIRNNGDYETIGNYDNIMDATIARRKRSKELGFSERHGRSQKSSIAWLNALNEVFTDGEEFSPRGKETREIIAHTLEIDMLQPMIQIPLRKPGYKFAAAEAHWILSGTNDLAYIKKFSPIMGNFSDDGVFLAGAYGPKLIDQLPYIIKTLKDDPSSRQAVVNIWRERPYLSADVACTLSAQFMIRKNKLHCIVSMRSSDIWLGVPYDIVTFSCIAHYVISLLREAGYSGHLVPGTLHNFAASRHLYASNYEAANTLLSKYTNGEKIDTDTMDKSLWLFLEKPKAILHLLDVVATNEGGNGFLDLLK